MSERSRNAEARFGARPMFLRARSWTPDKHVTREEFNAWIRREAGRSVWTERLPALSEDRNPSSRA